MNISQITLSMMQLRFSTSWSLNSLNPSSNGAPIHCITSIHSTQPFVNISQITLSIMQLRISTSWSLNSPNPSSNGAPIWLHNFHTQHTTVCEYFPNFLSPPLRIQLQLFVTCVTHKRHFYRLLQRRCLSDDRVLKDICAINISFATSQFSHLLSLFWNEKNINMYRKSVIKNCITSQCYREKRCCKSAHKSKCPSFYTLFF